MKLEPYQQRIVDEKVELDTKLSKLDAFMDSAKYQELPAEDRVLLMQQKSVMVLYSQTLSQRIGRFSQPQPATRENAVID